MKNSIKSLLLALTIVSLGCVTAMNTKLGGPTDVPKYLLAELDALAAFTLPERDPSIDLNEIYGSLEAQVIKRFLEKIRTKILRSKL